MIAAVEPREPMVAAIVATYRAASPEQVTGGRAWYPRAGRIIEELAAWSGLDVPTMAAVVAALSPRNPWAWNVQDAAAVAWAARHGEECPKVTTFGDNRDRAWALATGGTSWRGSALKVRSFVANMTGDAWAVTVDVWAVRVATGGRRNIARSDVDYQNIAAAYREAAAIVGETPRDIQAVTWLVGQTAGLGSARRGRHDRTLKVGTFAHVATLLTGQLALAL